MKLLALGVTLSLAAAAPAQLFRSVFPTTSSWSSNNHPLAGATSERYHQFFYAPQFVQVLRHPVRINGVDFLAGTPGGQAGAQVDMEMTMANGPATPSAFLDANLASGVVKVVPRSMQTLGTATGYPLQIDFRRYGTEFVWDGVSPIVVEILIYNNGRGGQPYTYDLQATFVGVGSVWRGWGIGADPRTVQNATFTQANAGLAMQFVWEEGVTVPFDIGCAGAGGAVPVASTKGGHPLPGNSAWTHVLSNANSSVSAVLLFGGSRTVWGTTPLPLDLGIVGAPGCKLLNDVIFSLGTITVGGGFGSGAASINVPIPPVTIFFGASLYNQWLIWDAQSPSGVLSMSQGLWSVFG